MVNVEGKRYPRGRPYYPDMPQTDSLPQPHVEMTVRCRRCEKCRQYHARHWTGRAHRELQRAVRTWMVTFTLRPEAHYRAMLEGGDDTLDARHSVIGKWLQDYLKRVRKQSNVPFRYLLVLEAHKSGLPHYHMLLHETVLGKAVTKRCIEGQWPHGFVKAKLVNMDASPWRVAWYVAKYLSKDTRARVRASVAYGKSPLGQSRRTGEREEQSPKRGDWGPSRPERLEDCLPWRDVRSQSETAAGTDSGALHDGEPISRPCGFAWCEPCRRSERRLALRQPPGGDSGQAEGRPGGQDSGGNGASGTGGLQPDSRGD